MYQERSLLLIHFFVVFALLLYIIRLISVQFALRGLLEKDSVTQGDI